MSLADLVHKAHDMAFESDPTPAPKPAVPRTPPQQIAPAQLYTPPATPNYVPYPTPGQIDTSVATTSDNDAYNILKARTSIESTTAFQILNKYLAPLENVPLDPKTKFTTAWAQAQAIDHITKEQFLAAIDATVGSLSTAQDDFNGWIKTQADTLVTPKQAQIDQLTAHINDLNQQIQAASLQIQQTSSDKADAEAKVARARSQFDSAMAVRTRELGSQKANYEALLA